MISNKELENTCNSDFDAYSEYRRFLVEGEQKVSEGLDKAILVISSAALGITFSLFKELLNHGNIQSLYLIKATWASFGLSLTGVLLSLLLSGHAYYLSRLKVDKLLINRTQILKSIYDENINHPDTLDFQENLALNRSIRFFHYSGATLLLTGVLLLGIFINNNIGTNLDAFKTTSKAIKPYPTQLVTKLPRAQNSISPTSSTSSETAQEVTTMNIKNQSKTDAKKIIPNQAPPPPPPPKKPLTKSKD